MICLLSVLPFHHYLILCFWLILFPFSLLYLSLLSDINIILIASFYQVLLSLYPLCLSNRNVLIIKRSSQTQPAPLALFLFYRCNKACFHSFFSKLLAYARQFRNFKVSILGLIVIFTCIYILLN